MLLHRINTNVKGIVPTYAHAYVMLHMDWTLDELSRYKFVQGLGLIVFRSSRLYKGVARILKADFTRDSVFHADKNHATILSFPY